LPGKRLRLLVISGYAPELVSQDVLLQTEDYARAVLERHPNVTPEQVAERVAGRLARQAVLDRDDPPLSWVLLDENVLHREIGDAKIMRDQLAHLAGMARRPNITVQVIPRIGAHVGLSGAFVMAETPESQVVYLDHIADGMIPCRDPPTLRLAKLFTKCSAKNRSASGPLTRNVGERLRNAPR
jgi:Domain of unknown function (DUF5753)